MTEPSSPPTDFSVMATSSESVIVSWGPPPPAAQNGIITLYILTCQSEERNEDLTMTMKFPEEGEYSLSGFRPATTYSCTVLAITGGGSGPPAMQTITLPDDGKLDSHSLL